MDEKSTICASKIMQYVLKFSSNQNKIKSSSYYILQKYHFLQILDVFTRRPAKCKQYDLQIKAIVV